MFVDKAQVMVQAGDGGDGKLSFRHEKTIAKGGPDGGDGGRGGNVVLVASRNQNTLVAFRYQKLLKAESGQAGDKRKKHGKNGEDLLVPLPVGTTVIDSEGQIIADLVTDGQQVIIARGGQGGFGNAHFTSSTRQAPRIVEKGDVGQKLELSLELKMIADVGLVGLPNAGKSTFLAAVSNARPEIADYAFTTVRPNLGVVDIDKETSLLFADIPGLIEGASQGKGLGDEFLRHVERTTTLLHLIDAYQDDIVKAYQTIQQELKDYKIDLTTRPQIVALTKVEGLDAEMVADLLQQLKKVVPKGTALHAISAQSKLGLQALLYEIKNVVQTEHARMAEEAPDESLPVIRLSNEELSWHITKQDDTFVVVGSKIERFARRTDFSTFHGEQRIRDIMQKMGIMRELIRSGIQPGEKITIGKPAIAKIEY